jgi:hypothetical protein
MLAPPDHPVAAHGDANRFGLPSDSYYAGRYQHTKRRLGRQRGPKVAQIDLGAD